MYFYAFLCCHLKIDMYPFHNKNVSWSNETILEDLLRTLSPTLYIVYAFRKRCINYLPSIERVYKTL